MSQNDSLQVTICKLVKPAGRHGPYVPYAVAVDERGIKITFSLISDVWIEDDYPEVGEVVAVSKLIRKGAGWRARKARRLSLFD